MEDMKKPNQQNDQEMKHEDCCPCCGTCKTQEQYKKPEQESKKDETVIKPKGKQ